MANVNRLDGWLVRLVVCSLLTCLLIASERISHAQSKEQTSVAMVGLDALGMDEERVRRLETLFLKELELLTGKRVPDRRSVARLKRKLQACDGGNKCLASIGKALKVEFVVAGSVGSLGDSFVLNIKAVSSKDGEELRRIESDPLRGQPDELIDAIRVAAYRLLAPEALVGSVSILADRAGAIVELDSKVIGKTPLAQPIEGLPLGDHALKVSAGEFGEFSNTIQVRFQKTTKVVVNLVDLRVKGADDPNALDPTKTNNGPPPKRWYQKTWFLISAGVGAAILGGYVGFALSDSSVVKCGSMPMESACGR
jgi:TolB-like protein